MTDHALWTLAWTQLWQITLLVVVVGVCARTALRRRPHVVYLLWAVVFVKCLTPPLWGSPTSVFSWLTVQQDAIVEAALPPELKTELIQRQSVPRRAPGPMLEGPRRKSLSVEDPQRGAPLPGVPQMPLKSSVDWSWMAVVLSTIWLVGVVMILALAACRWWDIYRDVARRSEPGDPRLQQLLQSLAAKLGLRRHVRLMVTASNYGPTVFGLYRPVVILPRIMVEGISHEKLEPIIAHELVHLRRGDTALGAIQFLAQVGWWFHPLVWWASREANRVCEQCCDEQAVAGLQCRPAMYAGALIDVLELKSRLRVGLAMPGMRPAEVTTHRVEHIMYNARRFHARTPLLYWGVAAVLSLMVLPGAGLESQDGARPEKAVNWRAEIYWAIRTGDYSNAESHCLKLLEVHPDDPRLLLNLGVALHGQRRIDEAIAMYERAAKTHATRSFARYNIACAHATQGRNEEALRSLEQAVDAGFFRVQGPLSEDSDFAQLRDDPRFQELEERARPPYRLDPQHQLDFLVGEWVVYTSDGRCVGSNRFEKQSDGPVVAGYWTNTEGSGGMSLNTFDAATGQWKRSWVDTDGTFILSTGGFQHQSWCMEGGGCQGDGTDLRTRMRMTPQPYGVVIQEIERSRDGGETWQLEHRLQYVRRSGTNDADQTAGQQVDGPPITTLCEARPLAPA